MNFAQHRVIAAGMIGNVLEWYDFAIYGYFAAAIGRQFFPHEDAVAQLFSAFGIFALGYLMRPVGGALTGHIGDRFGRRTALTYSVTAMAIPTFLIGLLPGYATLGLWAPAALTLLRMVQGLSVGGEYTSSMVFLVEHAPDGRRGLMGRHALRRGPGPELPHPELQRDRYQRRRLCACLQWAYRDRYQKRIGRPLRPPLGIQSHRGAGVARAARLGARLGERPGARRGVPDAAGSELHRQRRYAREEFRARLRRRGAPSRQRRHAARQVRRRIRLARLHLCRHRDPAVHVVTSKAVPCANDFAAVTGVEAGEQLACRW
jgi:hypothetical protein